VAAILRRAGAVVQTASSVHEALQAFRRFEPQVVVCDIAMPEADGYVFLREVRGRPDALRSTPILALTAFGRPDDRLHALNAGFDGYLKKPVDPAELAESVQRLAVRRKLVSDALGAEPVRLQGDDGVPRPRPRPVRG
jgi:CheY-like chemotaxis protein